MIRVIAIDLDDTLLAPDKSLPGPNIAAVMAATRAGIRVVIATARGFIGSAAIYRELQLETPLIVSSGARLVNGTGQSLWERRMPIDFCREVIEFGDREQIAFRVYTGDEIWNNLSFDPLVGQRFTIEKRVEQMAIHLQNAPFQIYTKGAREAQLLLERFGEAGEGYRCNVLTYGDQIPEVCILHPRSTKGAALADLCAAWDVPREQVMALGDSVNDLSMLEWAGVGVAMSWASDAVRERADLVTTKGNPAGCGEMIMQAVRGQLDAAVVGKKATGF